MDLATIAGAFAPMVRALKEKTGMVEREIRNQAELEFYLSELHDSAFAAGAENHVIEMPDVKGYRVRAFISARKVEEPRK